MSVLATLAILGALARTVLIVIPVIASLSLSGTDARLWFVSVTSILVVITLSVLTSLKVRFYTSFPTNVGNMSYDHVGQ